MALSALFLPSLSTSYTLETRLDVTWPDGSTDTLPFATGSVNVDAGQAVRRACSFDLLDMVAWREIVMGGAVLRPYRGVRYVDGGSEVAPLGVFEVRATTDPLDLLTAGKVAGKDRWSRLMRTRFVQPYASQVLTVPAQIEQLAVAVFPAGAFGFDDQSGASGQCPQMVWERDRDRAMLDLAQSIGCEVFFDALGDLVLRPVPAIGDPSWTVAAAQDGEGGVLLGGALETTDEGAYSAVVVSPSRTDGTEVFAPQVAYDVDTSSATYAFGPFGVIPRFVSSPLVTTAEQALTVAQAELAKSVGNASSLSADALVNPALQEGQTIEVVLPDGRRQLHVVEAFTVGMDPEGSSMPIKTRSRTVADS